MAKEIHISFFLMFPPVLIVSFFIYSDAEVMALLHYFFEISSETVQNFPKFMSVCSKCSKKQPLFFVAFCCQFSAYRVPGFIRLRLKGAHVGFYLHFEFSSEIYWCSPRVPAGAASAIFESAGSESFAGFVNNRKSRWWLP